ncbi:mucin-13 [Morus bassanus]
MRHCVFLTVFLTLMLSLLKGNDTTTSTAAMMTTTETAPGNDTTTSTAATTTTNETAPGNDTTTSTAATTTTNETAPGNDTTTSTAATTTTNETAPGNDTTTSTAAMTTTTETAPGNDTTTSTAATTTTNETAPGNYCSPDPCGQKLAKCVALHSNFTCLCQYGFYYSNKDCHRGKIFPGIITLRGPYSSSVQNVNSVQYEEVFQNVTNFFADAFKNLSSFGQTVIVKIQPSKDVIEYGVVTVAVGIGPLVIQADTARCPSLPILIHYKPLEESRSLQMKLTVINLFMENSSVNDAVVTFAIKYAEVHSSYVSYYASTTYCNAFNCDTRTTYCKENMFPECICKNDFSKTEWDDRSCSDCSKDCSAEENKYCAKEGGVPTCKCLANFEKKNTKCVSCPVGYSGENCKNNSELILIIVGTVFGAIILSLVIAVSIVSVRAKHKQDPEKRKLIKSGYSNPNTSDDRQATMFPRVQTTSGHANPGYQPNNPYEMRSSNGGRFPERDYDDMYEISREPEGFRLQSRY